MNTTIIDTYTEEQAEKDGYLLNITTINPEWKNGAISHITTNLLTKAEINTQEEELNIPNLLDLLNNANYTLKTQHPDWFHKTKIELSNGQKQEIFIIQNSTGKYTLMLPQDY